MINIHLDSVLSILHHFLHFGRNFGITRDLELSLLEFVNIGLECTQGLHKFHKILLLSLEIDFGF